MNIQLQNQLENNLRKIIYENDLTEFQALANKIALELDVNSMDCAAALLCLLQEHFKPSHEEQRDKVKQTQACAPRDLRMLWYRLEVGRKHRVTVDGLKRLLVEESGVESCLIGRIDFRDKHTLIQLPSGMPQELLQHLKTVTINQQTLDIKRLKNRPNRKSRAARNKGRKPGNVGGLQNNTLGRGENNQQKSRTEGSRDKGVATHFLAKS